MKVLNPEVELGGLHVGVTWVREKKKKIIKLLNRNMKATCPSIGDENNNQATTKELKLYFYCVSHNSDKYLLGVACAFKPIYFKLSAATW